PIRNRAGEGVPKLRTARPPEPCSLEILAPVFFDLNERPSPANAWEDEPGPLACPLLPPLDFGQELQRRCRQRHLMMLFLLGRGRWLRPHAVLDILPAHRQHFAAASAG